MTNLIIMLSVCLGMAGPVVYLYHRHEGWTLIVATVLCLIGLIGMPFTWLSLKPIGLEYLLRLLFANCMIPGLFALLEIGCRFLSLRIQHRDYILWLEHSSELRNERKEFQFWRKDVRTSWLDVVLSFGLLFAAFGMEMAAFSLFWFPLS